MNLPLLILLLLLVLWLGYLWGRLARPREQEIRRDALRRSRATLTGLASEQLAPYLPGFRWKPTEARFLGKPVDFIVFEGLDERRVDRVIFVEVKSGAARLSSVQRTLKDAIKDGRVSWDEYRVTTASKDD